jgi:AcrR family transcriptional regulator
MQSAPSDPQGQPGRRERKKLETRRALVEAAQRLVLERGGPDQVTVEEIAEAADVSVRTFFNYFPAKEDAVVGMDPGLVEGLGRAVIDRPLDEAPLEAVWRALVPPGLDVGAVGEWWVRRTQLLRQHPGLTPRHMAGMMQLERALYEAVVVRTGAPEHDQYCAVVVSAALAIFRMTVGRWDAIGRSTPLDADLAAAFELLSGGLRPPDGHRAALAPVGG